MRNSRFLWCLVVAYVAGLGVLGMHFRNALNADAVAYLRIASYYAKGDWGLAVSGYWGPMASWLMAGLLKLGCPLLAVGRVFMGISAVVFLFGCVSIYRAFNLPEKWVRTGAILAALAGLYWSVQFITPDLLLSGLMGFAVSRMLGRDGWSSAPVSVAAGVLWGLAYLTKAVAFPLALLAMMAFGGLAFREKPLERRRLLRHLGMTLLAFGLAASPWVLTLSLKYRALTVSSSARISHTLTGPPEVDRYHPFARGFYRPEPGRVTAWEEPSRMAYRYWSPLESWAYAWHQARVIGRNLSTCLALITSLNLAWLIPLVALGAQRARGGSWPAAAGVCGRALVMPALLGMIYLPCYVTLAEQRFFYGAFPFLFAALGVWAGNGGAGRVSEARGWWLALLGGILPLLGAVLVIGDSPRIAGECAVDLARRIERANLAGPIAGSGMLPGGRAGLYVGFLLDQPWYGDERQPRPAALQTSGARLVVTVRGSGLASRLSQEPGFVDRDERLFRDAAEAAQFPLQVFEIGYAGGGNRSNSVSTGRNGAKLLR
jgi:hypothetical protein